MVTARAWGREKGELLVNGRRVSVFPDEKVLETVYTIIGIYLKPLNCILKNDYMVNVSFVKLKKNTLKNKALKAELFHGVTGPEKINGCP